jgi:hypothetical protein
MALCPIDEARTIGITERFMSSRVGIIAFHLTLSRLMSLGFVWPIEVMISETPNIPMASALMLRPSSRSSCPNVNLDAPLWGSMPTVARMMPSTTMASPLMADPSEIVEAATRPRTISEKYSAEPNDNA